MTNPLASSSAASLLPGTIADAQIIIKERDLDSFGHVNNASYLTLFEDARWDIITKRGYGLSRIQQLKIGPVILEVSLKFKHEVRNREVIKITTGVLSRSGKITTLRQIMYNSRNEEACIADFVVGLFDLQARKLIEPTTEWNKALGLS